MKLTHAGDLMIDGKPRRGVFLTCNEWEIADLLKRVKIFDEAYVIPAPRKEPDD